MRTHLLALLCLLASCNHSQKTVTFNKQTPAQSTILTEAIFSIPINISKQGDLLYTSVFTGDSLLHTYDLRNQTWVKQLLPSGEGPNEFLSPIEYFMADSALFIHNRWHFTAKNYAFNASDFTMSPKGELIKLPPNVDRIYPLSESRFIASGVFDDCRFLLLDHLGQIVTKCGDYPNFLTEEDAIPNTAKAMFHQSQFGYHATQNRIATASSNVLELWDYAADTLTLHKRLLLSPYHYQYESGPDGIFAENDNPDAALGTRGIAVTNQYIYVLYNPNSHQMVEEHAVTQPSEIWVFDWEGTPVRKIVTDTQVECFCVNKDDTALYAVMAAPDYCLGMIPIVDE